MKLGRPEIGEVAPTLEQRRHVDQSRGDTAYFARALVVTKKEQLVLHDREADGTSELVALERTPIQIEVIAGVQLFVAEEFVSRAVNLVGPTLRDHVDDGARKTTILGIK